MNVVGRQAIGPDLGGSSTSGVSEQIEIERVIASLEKGLLATVAALGHVIRIAGQHQAGETSHEAYYSDPHRQ